ncbi:MAG: FkbM family methyltransferase, partial [Planctomycetales bacterium]|nr:FkbM family methyltransferase [Planctomycetales bacterium]
FAQMAGELRRVAAGERSLSADPPSSSRLSAVPTSAGMRQIKENPSAPRSSGASTNSLAPSPSSSHSHGSPITNAMTTVAQALTQAWQIHQSGDIASAENIYRQVLSAQPESANGWCYLGIACHDLDRFEEAESAYREALRLQPEFPVALNNMGNTLRRLGRIDEALASFRRALELKPDYLNAFKNAGTTLVWEGRFDEAIDWYSQALRLNPDEAESHRNVGIIRLLQGDFTNGWPEYEWRWRADDLKKPPHAQPEWQGESLDGKTILLYAEQGLGDTLNFVRYANVLKQLGARTIVQVQPPLVPLLRSTPGIDTLVPQREQPPAFDVHAPLLSVPAILKTDLDSIPADVPYVFADERLIEFWRSELRSFGGLRVGIVWQGNPDHQADHLRSVPLTRFAPLAALPGVQLFSLQKGHGAEQLAGAGANINVVNLGARLDESSGAFLDTAAVMKVLDLVITTDTSIAHLAGALGVPTWLALPYVPDWRWLLDREDSPWYPSMRLFRQTQPGDWDGVFERLTEALRQQAEAKAASPLPDGASAGAAESTVEASADSAASALPNTSASPTAVRHEEEPATLARRTTLAGFNDLVRARYGVMLYNRHDRYIGRSLNLYGEFSEGEVDLFRAMLKPGDVVLEAGANIGVHTLPLSQLVGKKGTVLAFEPQRIVFQTLCANMALNSVQNVHAHQQALGDTQGRVPVPALDYTRENNFGGLSLGRQAQGEPVPLVTIDALAVSRCNLLKVDVEGMEQQVLRGARQTIERHRPFLYVENDRAEQSAALVQLMRSFGYRLFWHTPPLFNPRNYFGNEQNVFDTIASFNVLGVHQAIRADIQGLREVE